METQTRTDRKRRSPSDFVCQYLQKHSFEDLDKLSDRLCVEHASIATHLAGRLAACLGFALMPEPAPGTSYVLMRTEPEEVGSDDQGSG